jgi:hypothetical protein
MTPRIRIKTLNHGIEMGLEKFPQFTPTSLGFVIDAEKLRKI